MPSTAAWAAFCLLLAGLPSPAGAARALDATVAAVGQQTVEVPLMELPSVRRLFGTVARERHAMTAAERVAAWSEFSVLVEAVVGGGRIEALAFDDLARSLDAGGGPRVPAAPGVAARDATAYRLLAVGYSAGETADVLNGRISPAALDTARKILAVGRGHDVAANYLDGEYKRVLALRERVTPQPPSPRPWSPTQFDGAIERYARLYSVDPSLVRAVIRTESAFNPSARSHAGAIGLMQLMPMTARELGVNPWIPEQNIEGGVRYLAGLLKMFGGLELALIAYNAGPGFARRYARGETALYGETRDYVKKVTARFFGR